MHGSKLLDNIFASMVKRVSLKAAAWWLEGPIGSFAH